MLRTPEKSEQVSATLEELRRILADGSLAVYLHGSAVLGGRQPQSDIDLPAVVDRGLSEDDPDVSVDDRLWASDVAFNSREASLAQWTIGPIAIGNARGDTGKGPTGGW